MAMSRAVPAPLSPGNDIHLIVGIFSTPDGEPQEISVDVKDAKSLFRKFRWATWRLRGMYGFFSLKTVAAFKVYECIGTNHGGHRRIDLDDASTASMKQLFLAYKQARFRDDVAIKWAKWINVCLNENSYSIELVLDWSPTRLAIALLSPVALSLAVGSWFNSRDWTDLATIQTAWGIASYVVTATGCM
ncbi:hypothetical protein M406DRAFT_322039 [Cryphonectria parasitica EP155]|uniref:Uncharacterized protein n=1 Tax=Cryphonectria parasitica (strain ATCC 38755 / EP155) TaxID=660469 RepID=A0A9P4Y2X2_CRYP1|nr:uncharacterized protein M406DRAFT_322039 [Cryphonectria parasitica EP155]KAF3765673.1 hypothetical protein M406DRAFT_322039 [Cryphonectria parasitica EP155]